MAFVVYGALYLFSASMQAEFIRFGLEPFRVFTGILEVLGGVGLLVGVHWSPALWLSSAGLATLMLCGVIVRVVVDDPVIDTLPAFLLMLINGWIFWASWTRG